MRDKGSRSGASTCYKRGTHFGADFKLIGTNRRAKPGDNVRWLSGKTLPPCVPARHHTTHANRHGLRRLHHRPASKTAPANNRPSSLHTPAPAHYCKPHPRADWSAFAHLTARHLYHEPAPTKLASAAVRPAHQPLAVIRDMPKPHHQRECRG